MIMFLLFV